MRYYILFNEDLRVVGKPTTQKPIDWTKTLTLAECDNLPNKYDYLEVANVQTKTDTWTEKERVEKLDENGNPIVEEVEVEKSRTYLVCDLVAKFRPAPTQEQIAIQNQKRYESLCHKYIAEKYCQNDENKVVREYLSDMTNIEKKAQFDEYNAYVESCKARARVEVYG